MRAGDFKSISTADTSVEHEPRRCFYSLAAARALRPFMACAVEKADKTRTAAFYLAPARAPRPHGQFTDSAEKPPCSRGVSSAQGIPNPMTVPPRAPSGPRTIRRIVPGRPAPPRGIVPAAVRTLVAALVLSTSSLVGAQVWVAPSQGTGGRDAPGTLQNPYIVYDHGCRAESGARGRLSRRRPALAVAVSEAIP